MSALLKSIVKMQLVSQKRAIEIHFFHITSTMVVVKRILERIAQCMGRRVRRQIFQERARLTAGMANVRHTHAAVVIPLQDR